MAFTLGDMTLRGLRKMSHEESNFPNLIRNSSLGICATETYVQTSFSGVWRFLYLFLFLTYAHMLWGAYSCCSNISPREKGISPEINDNYYLCL
jgi:hypothetical protein